MKGMEFLVDVLTHADVALWRPWYDQEAPETILLPDALDTKMTKFQRLLLVCAMNHSHSLALSYSHSFRFVACVKTE